MGRRQTGLRHDKVRETFLDLSGPFDLESVRGYDALIHLAYCVEEPRDKRRAYQVNVAATRTLLEQAREAGIGQARPHLERERARRGRVRHRRGRTPRPVIPAGDQDAGHYYFQHKALLEHLANWYWVNANDGKTTLAVVRPCYVVGEHFDNSGLRTMLSKSVVYPKPSRSFYQFLWDTDLVDAYATILTHGLSGFTTSPRPTTPACRRSARSPGPG